MTLGQNLGAIGKPLILRSLRDNFTIFNLEGGGDLEL